MIEVIAAIAGASISVAAMGAMGFGKRNDEARDAVIGLPQPWSTSPCS
jgi:hypothetical protein